jgi:cytosine/adenosine deaminase-related metal-dependent hydrolase
MIYSASLVFPGDGPPIREGWIQVEGNRITATGSASSLPANIPEGGLRRLEGCALLPGLINLHCHLELTGLHEALDAGKPFPEWVGQLRERTTEFTPADYRAAARAGIDQLIAGGCTTVLDVGNTGEALIELAQSPLRSFACVETLGLGPAVSEFRFAAAQAKADQAPATNRFHPGIAPHGAYSMSRELLRATREHQSARGLPYTIHAAESREEAELFASGTGPLAEYCRRIYPNAPHHFGTTPIRWLESEGLLPDGALIIHGNMLDDADMNILARRKATVVHCPTSHAFFGHPRFPYESLRGHGINVGLGTDSLASGNSLSMLEQMRLFNMTYPDVPMEDVVAMATVNGARALGLKDTGLLKSGYLAEAVVVKIPSDDVIDPKALFGGTVSSILVGSDRTIL